MTKTNIQSDLHEKRSPQSLLSAPCYIHLQICVTTELLNSVIIVLSCERLDYFRYAKAAFVAAKAAFVADIAPLQLQDHLWKTCELPHHSWDLSHAQTL